MLDRYQKDIIRNIDPPNGLDFNRYLDVVRSTAQRFRLTWEESQIIYPLHNHTEAFIVLKNRGFGTAKRNFTTRVLIHGEEDKTGTAFAVSLPEIAQSCEDADIGYSAIVAGNPWGARLHLRYNPAYISGIHVGNDDLGRFYDFYRQDWVDESIYKPFDNWRLVNPKIDRIPAETVANLDLLQEWEEAGLVGGERRSGRRIVASLDGHSDQLVRGGAYYYGYGKAILEIQRGATATLSELQLKKPRRLLSGAGDDGHGGAKVYVNRYGLIHEAHDGGFASVMALMGVSISVALEIADREGVEKFAEAYLRFAKFMIQEAAKVPLI